MLAEKALSAAFITVAVTLVTAFNEQAHQRMTELLRSDPYTQVSAVSGKALRLARMAHESAAAYTGDNGAVVIFTLVAVVLAVVMLRQ